MTNSLWSWSAMAYFIPRASEVAPFVNNNFMWNLFLNQNKNAEEVDIPMIALKREFSKSRIISGQFILSMRTQEFLEEGKSSHLTLYWTFNEEKKNNVQTKFAKIF